MTRLDVRGATYNVERRGRGAPLLLLHGFTGASSSWVPLMERLEERFDLIAPDLLGHGATDAPDDPARYGAAESAADLLALLDRLGVDRFGLLGYSMGGRIALHLALAAGPRLERLILESATAGIEDPAERASRVAADTAMADDLERDGVAAFVARWERAPIFASQAALDPAARANRRAQRLRHSARGLANSLRGVGAGAAPPLWSRLREIAGPTLVVAGALDEKYVALARRLAESLPDAHLKIAPDAGHNVHLERPGWFADAATEFTGALAGAPTMTKTRR